MRDRRLQLGKRDAVDDNSIEVSGDDSYVRKVAQQRRDRANMREGIFLYAVFFLVFLGIPVFLILYFTPFFVIEKLQCRAADHLWSDPTVAAMENGYAAYFDDPPLYPSEAYNQTMLWGTYEPSRIFAMKSRTELPVTVGIAWYDEAHDHPLRHVTPFLHNKVRPPRTVYKKGRDPEVMQVRWIVHDGIHYGKQTVHDPANKVSLELEFLKGPSGRSWHLRIQGNTDRTDSPVHFVLYILNGDVEEKVDVLTPDGNNDGDWSPRIQSSMVDHTGKKAAFTMVVHDRHSPLVGTAPWRIYGLRVHHPEKAFELKAVDTVGGTPAERVAAGGKGIAGGFESELLRQQHVDLRYLPTESTTLIESTDRSTFRAPPAMTNMIVMKKKYDTHFRLEVSFSPLAHPEVGGMVATPQYTALTSCQLSNVFRRREKRIYAHGRKIIRPWVNGCFPVPGKLYEHLATQLLGEAFGSMSFGSGRYLSVDPVVDDAGDARGSPMGLLSDSELQPSAHTVSAFAALGSRTDEAFGQASLTGLQLLFLTRWNKEIVKDVIASWLLGAQDPVTGFVPSRTGFTAEMRSMMPRDLRYERVTHGSPPTLLLGLQALLDEMDRKGVRIGRANQHKTRNTAQYLGHEQSYDTVYLQRLLPALKRWRTWWHHTQCGGIGEAAALGCRNRRSLEAWPTRPTGDPADLLVYRWRSRDEAALRTSGMEDYPRPICPGAHRLEAHVDLFSWVALLSRTISRIELRLDVAESAPIDWEAHLNALHWDASQGRYADRVGCEGQDFSPYVGYVTLFPVLLGVVRADLDKINHTLRVAAVELLTSHGIMSVSYDSVRAARLAGLSHRNLWMGQVWPSINLMLLHALQTTYLPLVRGTPTEGTATELYSRVRLGIAETMRTGGRWWELYNPVDGSGEGSKTYIGSQALLLGILSDYA